MHMYPVKYKALYSRACCQHECMKSFLSEIRSVSVIFRVQPDIPTIFKRQWFHAEENREP